VRNAEDITPPATSPSRGRDLADGLAALAPLGGESGGDVRGWLDTPIERALSRVVLEDFAPLAVVRVDDGAAFVNKNYLKLYGLTREDERLASHRAQLADEVGAALARFRDNAPTMGSETIVVERKLAVDGGRHYRVHYLPIFDARQRLAACAVLYYDVSSETAALDRLRGVQALFRDVLRSASDWVWETDAGGLISFISDRIAQVAGVPPTLLVGRPLTALGIGHDDGRRLAHLLEARGPFRGFVLDVRDREGRPRRHQLSGVPFFEEGGRFIGFRGTGTDVSAQHAAEVASRESRRKLEETLSELHQQNQRLDSALERAQAAARSKGEFLANMSHELRTPLNAIIGFADIISGQSFGQDPARYSDYAGDILKAGKHLLRIVDDVLEYSRREQTAITVVTHAVDVGEIVEEAHAYVYEAARRRGIDLTIGEAAERLAAVVDRTRALQVVINLMSNAVKFTPIGGKVGVEIAALPGAATITVWDTGPGIALDQQERVFEPFYQVHAEAYSRPHEGVGLGLAIARRLARMMGGDVTLESVPGEGARFTARFARAGAPPEATPASL
jgi:signal transduction histidine kinase